MYAIAYVLHDLLEVERKTEVVGSELLQGSANLPPNCYAAAQLPVPADIMRVMLCIRMHIRMRASHARVAGWCSQSHARCAPLKQLPTSLLRRLLNVRFEGVSGRVEFTSDPIQYPPVHGERHSGFEYRLLNYQSLQAGLVEVGRFSKM